jgi:hypothetical protein
MYATWFGFISFMHVYYLLWARPQMLTASKEHGRSYEANNLAQKREFLTLSTVQYNIQEYILKSFDNGVV